MTADERALALIRRYEGLRLTAYADAVGTWTIGYGYTKGARAGQRCTVRLPAEMVEAIDAECSRRAGNVSRNTWITEAVQEKLARNGAASQSTSAGEGA